jgi:hypothetical protein
MLFPYRLSLAAPVLSAALVTSLATSLVTSLATPASAQSRLPACPPPTAQEFLVLVRGETEADRSKIATILPETNTVLVCQYLDETLVRAGGFTSLETANAWASYMTTVEGFESFVSRPNSQVAAQPTGASTGSPPASSPSASSQAANSASASSAAYQPRRLAPGYAVLVSYGSQLEIANTVGQLVRPVGLAVYRQQAYLLADYSSDEASALATLQRLNDAQLTAILVDAEQVVRLSAEVAR